MRDLSEYKAAWNQLVHEARPDVGWVRYTYSMLIDSVEKLDYANLDVQSLMLTASNGALSMLTYMLQNGMNTAEASKLYWKIHLYRAPWYFESYM